MAKILCISDIHYSAKGTPGVYTDDPAIKLNTPVGTKDIRVLVRAMEEIGPIDLLIFCGDMITGKDSAGEKQDALNDISQLIDGIVNSKKIFGNDVDDVYKRIIYVPGNHDVDRNTGGKLQQGIPEIFNQCLHPQYKNERVHKYAPIFIFDDLKLIVAAVSTVENSGSKNDNIMKVLQAANSLPETCDTQKNEIVQSLKRYSSYDIPSITSEAVENFISNSKAIAQDDEKYREYKRIMVSHHPLLEGIASLSSLKKYSGTVGGYGFMKSAEEFGYTLFVHGHLHEHSCVEIIDHLSENKKPVIQLGLPKMELDREGCGCVLIDIDDGFNDLFPFTCTLLKPDSIAWKFKQTPLVSYKEGSPRNTGGDRILVDYEIAKIIQENKIVKNGDLRNVEAASYDCALGYEYKKGVSRFCDWSTIEPRTIASEESGPAGIVLEPNETALIFSYEEFDIPKDMVLHASPISSWLRKGIRFDISFFVDPGFVGKFAIPVTNESENSITIDAQKPIVSLEFVKLASCCEKGWSERHLDLASSRSQMVE